MTHQIWIAPRNDAPWRLIRRVLLPSAILFLLACQDTITGPRFESIRTGNWGSDPMDLTVTGGGASAAFRDCAGGGTTRTLLIDSYGRFYVEGTYSLVRPDIGTTARFAGRVDGDRMTLTVEVEANAFFRHEKLGPFFLTYGTPRQFYPCR
jgi:hypothetical protein